MLNLNKFSSRDFDWIMFGAVVLLAAIGLSAIYSIDLSRGLEFGYFRKQSIAFVIGLILLFVAYFTQYTFYRSSAKWWYVASLIILLAVLIFGRDIRGTKGWFEFGGFSFQPVEFAKIGLILILSYIISRFGRRFDKPLFFFGTAAVVLLLIGLVMLQPDLGSAILLGLIWFGLMCLTGARRLYIFLLMVVVAAVGVLGWYFLMAGYQKARLATFINPENDPLGAGYNITQSIIAIGAGKMFGRGLGFGSQSQLRFLPEAQTDFIFSVIGEELGMAGAGVVVILYGILLWRLILLIRRTNDDFISAAASGATILFAAQFFVNIGACIGLMPVTGVTLPFISYGGSSLVMNLLLIGVMESMMRRRN